MLELDLIADTQFAVPTYQAAASLALWRGDPADARRVADGGMRIDQNSGLAFDRADGGGDFFLVGARGDEGCADVGERRRRQRELAGSCQ